MAEPQPPWSYGTLKSVAAVLAETENGLTGREIDDLLARLNMSDPLPDATKRDRLAEAFVVRQNEDRSPKRVITFIVAAMEPVRYRDRPEFYAAPARGTPSRRRVGQRSTRTSRRCARSWTRRNL
ncbi:hypothetical protein LP52_00570 [Streptomonospora alba]|uniref:Uncharacterized protein n=1 Tax=Streptomonospora alba TaxID=183763 RepID=A0A0C2FMN7_9ACTN|nr:hypothetical protein [Streptomonospora alba]KII00630.1 hypothetical protein LP52_00570 [Streptomonospora alba]